MFFQLTGEQEEKLVNSRASRECRLAMKDSTKSSNSKIHGIIVEICVLYNPTRNMLEAKMRVESTLSEKSDITKMWQKDSDER
jgi:hypothetical protein